MARTRSPQRPDAPPPDRLDLPDHAKPASATQPRARTAYDADAVEAVFADMSTGMSLRRSCERHGLAPSSVATWVRRDEPVGISEQYARAREQQAHALADGVIDMAIDPDAKADPNLLRVRLDAAKWAAARILPKVYGDRIDVNSNVSASVQVGWVLDLTPPTDGTPILDGTAVRVETALPAPSDPQDVV